MRRPAALSGGLEESSYWPGWRLWRSWRWQLANQIKGVEGLKAFFPAGSGVLAPEVGRLAGRSFRPPFAVTPYYLSLARSLDYSDPIIAQCLPRHDETLDSDSPSGLDPLREDANSPTPRLIRKYHDRAVVLATGLCAVHCRHCDRKRLVGDGFGVLSNAELGVVVDYLSKRPEIRDVIVSGGDPLTLDEQRLDAIISALRSISSIEILRIGSRVPVVLPQRIIPSLARVLKKHAPLFLNTQFNHPVELTPEAEAACARLADAGVVLGNQSVLLKGVNDSPATLGELCEGLLRLRVRPYYLFQCEAVAGNDRFVSDTAAGAAAVKSVMDRHGGMAAPVYALDTAAGKIQLPGGVIGELFAKFP